MRNFRQYMHLVQYLLLPDDTTFRVYQEYVSPGAQKSTWFSIAGTIEELREFATILEEDGSKNAKELRGKILAEIPRFEEGEIVSYPVQFSKL